MHKIIGIVMIVVGACIVACDDEMIENTKEKCERMMRQKKAKCAIKKMNLGKTYM